MSHSSNMFASSLWIEGWEYFFCSEFQLFSFWPFGLLLRVLGLEEK